MTYLVVQPHDMDPEVRRAWRAILSRPLGVATWRTYVVLEPAWDSWRASADTHPSMPRAT